MPNLPDASVTEIAEYRRDANRYRWFRAFVSKGDLSQKHTRAAFDMWFARYYPESDLDAAIDKAMPNLIDAFNGDAPMPHFESITCPTSVVTE